MQPGTLTLMLPGLIIPDQLRRLDQLTEGALPNPPLGFLKFKHIAFSIRWITRLLSFMPHVPPCQSLQVEDYRNTPSVPPQVGILCRMFRGTDMLYSCTGFCAALLLLSSPSSVPGVDFQADGILSMQDVNPKMELPPKPIRVEFSVGAKGDCWSINTVWNTNILSVTSFDGTNQYLLTAMRQPGKASSQSSSAAMISEHRSLRDELSGVRTLWLTFLHFPHLDVGELDPFPAPFGRDGSAMVDIFAASLSRRELPPGLAARIDFKVSQSRLLKAIQDYSGRDKAIASDLKNTYTPGTLGGVLEVSKTRSFEGLEIPASAELRQNDPLHPDRVISVMQITLTNLTNCRLESFAPQLERTTWVRDIREGEVYLYAASNQIWLSRAAATNIGKRLVPKLVVGEHGPFLTFIGTYGALILVIAIALAPLVFLIVRKVTSTTKKQVQSK
jgi:hypothetical protein